MSDFVQTIKDSAAGKQNADAALAQLKKDYEEGLAAYQSIWGGDIKNMLSAYLPGLLKGSGLAGAGAIVAQPGFLDGIIGVLTKAFGVG